MLSLQTRSDWAAASVTVTIGVDVDVWTWREQDNSAVDALEIFCVWANDAARAWFGLALFSWRWSRDAATGGAFMYAKNSGGAFTWAPNAAAVALLGIAGQVGVEAAGTVAAEGTWAPGPGGVLPLRMGQAYWLKAEGQASGVGSVRPGVAGLGAWAGQCRAVVHALEAQRWPAQVSLASHPRRAWLRLSSVAQATEYTVPPIGAGWLLCALGPVQRSKAGVALWVFDFDLGAVAL